MEAVVEVAAVVSVVMSVGVVMVGVAGGRQSCVTQTDETKQAVGEFAEQEEEEAEIVEPVA